MGNITANEVNKLRKATGAVIMDCKNALVEAEGNFDKAVEILRKKGQKVAAKRADRNSSEGVALAITNNSNEVGIGIVLACETDFVAKNNDFVKLAYDIADIALNCKTKEELLNSPFGNSTVSEKLIPFSGSLFNKLLLKIISEK